MEWQAASWLYREDLNRIYVTDGDAGDLKIFDGTTYGFSV